MKPKTDPKQVAIGYLCLLVWIISTIAIYKYIDTYGLPIPYADEWLNVPQAVGDSPITLKWIWSLHNEHRLPLHRLVYVAVIAASGNNFRSGMFVNLFVLSAIALRLLNVVRKIRGSVSITDVFIPICLVSYAHYENLLWSNQIQFVLTTLLLLSILAVISNSKKAPAFRELVEIAICLLLLPLCGASGIIPQMVLLVWFAVCISVPSIRKKLTKQQHFVLLSLLTIATSISIFYFVDYHPVYYYRSYDPADVLRGSMEFLSTSFGPAGIEIRKISSFICVLLIIGTLVLLGMKLNTRSSELFRVSGLGILTASLLVMMLSVGIGRSGSGGSGAAHRYATLTACLLLVIYFVFFIYGKRKWNLVPVLLLLFVLLAIPENRRIAIEYGNARMGAYQRFTQHVQDNLPVEALATRDLETIYPFYDPRVIDFIRILERHRIGPFLAKTQALPQVEPMPQEIELSMDDKFLNNRRGRFAFVFSQPEYILGFRTSFILENTSRQPQLFLSWGSEPYVKTIRYPLASASTEQTYSFWVYDSVKQIQVLAPQDHLRLSKMTLLLPRK